MANRRLPTRECWTCRERKPDAQFLKPRGKKCEACRRHDVERRCPYCGDPPGRTKHGRPRACCARPACIRAARVAGGARSKPPRPTGHKRCPNCEKKFPRTTEFWSAARRDPDTGEAVVVTGWCRTCQAAIFRDRYHADAVFADRVRERNRQRYRTERAKRAADPAYAAECREKENATRRRLKERKRAGLFPLPLPSAHEQAQGPEIPSAPLAAFIDRLAHRQKLELSGNAPASTNQSQMEIVCERLGINTRRVRAWREGESPTCRLTVADRVMTRAGVLWFDVYDADLFPVETAAAARIFEAEG